MDIGIVSMRYAKALMEYAKSTGTEDRLYAEMRMLSRSFEKDRKSTRLNSSHSRKSRMPSSA